MSVEWRGVAASAPPTLGGLGERDRFGAPHRNQTRRSVARLAIGALLLAFPAGLILKSALMRASAPIAAAAPVASAFVADTNLPPLIAFRPADDEPAAKYEARLRKSDGQRWDILAVGDPDSDGPFLRAVARTKPSPRRDAMFFVSIARQAADIGEAVERASGTQIIATAHGPLATLALTLAGANGTRKCVGFLFPATGAATLSGLGCAARGASLDPAAFKCLLGRLSVTSAGATAGLGASEQDPERAPSCAS